MEPKQNQPKRENLYKISELSKKLNITPRTIRFYEQMSLLPPARRTQGKMRLFDEADIKRIQEIRGLQKDRGMSLEQIKKYLGDEKQASPEQLAQKRLRIVTDVTCSLPETFFAEHDVPRLPIFIKVDKQIYGDKVKITNAELFNEVQRRGAFPSTLPADDKTLLQFFRKLSAEGAEQVLVLTLSTHLSDTFKRVSHIAQKFRDLHIDVVDTRTSAAGLGILVCEALRLKNEGLRLLEIKTRIEFLAPQVYQVFTVGSLEHLYKSGRVSPEVSGYMSLLLSFKPILALRLGKGHIELVGRADTSEAAYQKMFEFFQRYLEDKPEPRYVAVTTNGLLPDAETLIKTIHTHYPQANILLAEGHPVLGVHLGPQSVGLAVLSA